MYQIIRNLALCALASTCAAMAGALPDGWSPKFYPGLEAAGRAESNPTAFRGEPSIDLVWESGMPKFGVAKRFETDVKGVTDWTVSAYVKCGAHGRAGAAMEFFDDKGRSFGVVNGVPRNFPEWTRLTWKFTSPRAAARAEVHLLSLGEDPASFAHVEVSSCAGLDANDVPFNMKILPADWNRDWNGGRTRMVNFSDAPLPMTVLFKGERKALKAPAFEIDLPEELEIKDAFCPFVPADGRETPVAATPIASNGVRRTRLRFEGLRYFAHMQTAFNTDKGGGLALVIGPKAGGAGTTNAFHIVCRIADGERLAAERTVEMAFRPLPKGLRQAKRFFAMGWNSADRLFSDDAALVAALPAYEAAGLRMVRLCDRAAAVRGLLEKRPVPYVFAARFGDLWLPSKAGISVKELAALGGRLSVTSDGDRRRGNKICPEFFTTSAAFRRHLEEKAIRPALAGSGVRDGDWVTLDMEPWQSYTYCYCDDCLKAFAAFAHLDHVPTVQEASGMKDAWAEFRVRHSAKTVEIVASLVHAFNPTLKIIDYDYILEYGNPSNRAAFIRGCAKDTLLNEQWLDGHLCSYYHRVGRRSFEAMKNNVRNLKKPYYPMAGLSGYASWVRPGEVLNPRQIRQFALAAFVNGCPGYAFYPGNCFDGEVLLAMMEAQDAAARYEDLPWGRKDGTTAVEGPADRMACASTVRPDGSEVVAVFNYDELSPIDVTVGGAAHTVAPLDVVFVETAGAAAGGLDVACGESAPEKRAAAELKKYIALLAEEEPNLRFRIGVKYLDEFPEDKAFLDGWDGYAVRRKDGAIYIVSPQPRGCLFGVYDFLERNSDIIWARPDEDCGTIYTRTKAFAVREADFVERPKFQMRGWWFCGPQRHAASEYWHARVRCNFGCANQKFPDVVNRAIACGYFIGGAVGHNLPGFIPDAMYDVHPEYFAEINGVRRRDKGKTQFCFSNLAGADVVGSNAVLQIAEKFAKMKASFGVGFDHWALKQADNLRLCECAACRADIPLGDGRVARAGDVNFRANQFFRYLNRAVEIIEETYPDMRVDTFAYQFSAPPPDVKVHEKFNVAFCPFIKNDRFSVTNAVNAKWAARAEKWSKATPNIMWREYWGCASGYPRQHSFVAAEDLKWIHSALGFTRVYSETVPDLDNRKAKGRRIDYRTRWDASAMEHWVLSRLMWNPYVPVEDYREAYIRRTYRKAAAPMRAFYALIAQTWFSDSRPTNYTDDPVGNASHYIVGAGIDKRVLELLDEAARLAADDVPAVARLVSRQRDYFRELIKNCSSPAEPLAVPLVKDGDWSKAAVIDGFVGVRRNMMRAAKPSRRRTRVLVCHDAKNLKVKFICSDPDPSRLETKAPDASGCESFPGGDHVELTITTCNGRRSWQFGVDSKGNRADLANGDIDANAKWTSDVKVTKSGYEVELAIDFESIGAEITQENRFGACFARMSTPRTADEKRDFASWMGDHPQAVSPLGSLFIAND